MVIGKWQIFQYNLYAVYLLEVWPSGNVSDCKAIRRGNVGTAAFAVQ